MDVAAELIHAGAKAAKLVVRVVKQGMPINK
jgi:hypothetical protein